MTTEKHLVILDTDIGSDVDDAMALALILGRSDLDLIGVTTVYGDTTLRARLAQRYAGLAGHKISVWPGLEEPLSGREVWWAGHEGSLHPHLEREVIEPGDAVTFLIDQVSAHPGKLDLIAIGPLTNIAAAINSDPQFAANVRTLWVMGGNFDGEQVEHNFRSDAVAAHTVFTSGISAIVSGLDVTASVKIGPDHLGRVADAGPLGAALSRDINQWWHYWSTPWSVPHDPITVLSLAEPDIFQLSLPGNIEITVQPNELEGQSTFTPHPDGSTRVVVGFDPALVAERMIAGIESADRHDDD